MRIPFRLGIKHSTAFLRLSAACFAYLAAILLFSATLVGSMLSRQQEALGEELTLIAQGGNESAFAELLEAVRGAEAVTEVKPLDKQQVATLLEPWLGSDSDILELPQVAAVTVDRQLFSIHRLKLRLREAERAYGGEVEVTDHQAHFASSLARLRMLIGAKWLMLAALAAALGLASFFAVKSVLKAEKTTIEVLSVIGATDASIAFYFAFHGGWQVFVGGLGGLAAAAATVFFYFSAADLGVDILAADFGQWAAVPFVLAAFTGTVAWFSVIKLLRQ